MIFIIVPLFSFITIIGSKYFLGKWINHLSVYSFIWMGLILLYEWRLLPYVDIIPFTWFFICLAFLSLILGSMTVILARRLYNQPSIFSCKNPIDIEIFKDKGLTIKYALIIFSLISILSAIQHWVVLIKMYDNIPGVLLNANEIYRLNVRREIKDFIPYLPIMGYVGVFLSGIYTAHRGKFSFYTFLPFIGIILKELATVGRSGMLLALFEFIFSFLFVRNLLNNDSRNRYTFSKKNIAISSFIIVLLFVFSASLVRISRVSSEYYSGTSRELKQLKNNLIITPTIYLYFSSDVGVLSEYLKAGGEEAMLGQNTFLPFYDLFAKIGGIKRIDDVSRGYFIPMWSNTGTYLKELYSDFGIAGIVVAPYLLGILCTWLWFRFYRTRSIISLVFLVYLNLIIVFSFLHMITRIGYWLISLIMIVFLIPILEKISFRNYEAQQINDKMEY